MPMMERQLELCSARVIMLRGGMPLSNVVFFDGVDDYVDCGNNVSLQITAAITVDVLARRDKTGSYSVFAYKWVPGQGFIMAAEVLTNKLRVYISPGGSYVTVGDVLTLGRWQRLAFTWSTADNLIRIYVDGNLVGTSGAITPLTDSGASFKTTYPSGGFSYLAGLVAQVAVYNRVLTSDEIYYNYAHPNNPKRRGLVLNLTQDSIYGPTWLDLSGNANNGTYVGGAVPVSSNRLAGR